MNKRKDLLRLLENDSLGLLNDNKKTKVPKTEKDSLVIAFEEIVNFVEEYNRLPLADVNNIKEFQLHARLRAIKRDPQKVKLLKKYDSNSLLNGEDIRELSLDDIIAEDPFGLLSTDIDKSIFKVQHIKSVDRIRPQYLSRRRICPDYNKYQDMFDLIHEELSNRTRRLIKYNSAHLNVGRFFVLNGILLYLKTINGDVASYNFTSGERERFDGRTLCIFDNGTQSDMLFRSLDKAMNKDGYSISENIPQGVTTVESEHDVCNGYLYVLRSRNANVQHIPNLYKIGYTTGLVSARIKNAKTQSTYLFDDVEIVSTYRCLNISSADIEKKIHNFFSSVKLDIELFDSQNKIYMPREWFTIPIEIIEDAVELLNAEDMDNYIYDNNSKVIVKKN